MWAPTEERPPGPVQAILDNPVLRLELRHVLANLRRPWRLLAGWRFHSDPARRVAAYVAWVPVITAAPYLYDAFVRFLMRMGGAAAVPDPVTDFSFGALLLYGYAFFAGSGMVQMGALSFSRERSQGVLESLVTSRMSAGEIILGKALAIAIPVCAAASVAFGVWTLFPPLSQESHVFGLRFDQSPRVLLACLWLDAIATSVAGTFAGVAVSAWCRTTRGAAFWAVMLTFPVFLAIIPLAVVHLPSWVLSPQVQLLPAEIHLFVWGFSAVVCLVGFVLAQVRLNPVPVPVALFPGGRTRVRISVLQLTLGLAAGACLALILAWGLGSRGLRTLVATTGALSGAGQARAGLSLVHQGQYGRALPLLDAEIQRGVAGPMEAMLWEAKARCHQELGQYAQAIAAYDELGRVSTWPARQVTACRGKGECLLATGRSRAAAEMFRKAVEVFRANRDTSYGSVAALAEADVLRAARGLATLGLDEEALRAYEAIRGGSTGQRAREEMAWVREGLFRAPRLGVRYAAASLVVEEVEPGSGAEAAGVRAGDLVRSVAGKPVSDRPDVLRALAARSAGEVVPVGIERNGRARVLRIRLAPPFPAVFPTPAP